MTIEALETQLDEKVTAATAMLESQSKAAEAEKRTRTEDEVNELEALVVEARGLKTKIARAKSDDSLRAELAKLAPTAATPTQNGATPRVPLSMGQQFVQSKEYEYFRKGLHRTQSAWRSPSTELFATTLLESGGGG